MIWEAPRAHETGINTLESFFLLLLSQPSLLQRPYASITLQDTIYQFTSWSVDVGFLSVWYSLAGWYAFTLLQRVLSHANLTRVSSDIFLLPMVGSTSSMCFVDARTHCLHGGAPRYLPWTPVLSLMNPPLDGNHSSLGASYLMITCLGFCFIRPRPSDGGWFESSEDPLLVPSKPGWSRINNKPD